jgi:hypothetical protein
MSIKNDLCELERIKIEIKKTSDLLKTLRTKKSVLEKNLVDYLKKRDTSGIAYNNSIICLEKKEHRTRKKKKEKEKDISLLFQKNGINISSKLLSELSAIQLGPKQEKHILKFSST